MKIDFLTFWIAALACYRITVLITRDLGPFHVFKRLRSIDRCSKFLTCPFCVSPYVAAGIAVGFWLSGFEAPIVEWILIVFCWSAITIMADRTFTADYQN